MSYTYLQHVPRQQLQYAHAADLRAALRGVGRGQHGAGRQGPRVRDERRFVQRRLDRAQLVQSALIAVLHPELADTR